MAVLVRHVHIEKNAYITVKKLIKEHNNEKKKHAAETHRPISTPAHKTEAFGIFQCENEHTPLFIVIHRHNLEQSSNIDAMLFFLLFLNEKKAHILELS